MMTNNHQFKLRIPKIHLVKAIGAEHRSIRIKHDLKMRSLQNAYPHLAEIKVENGALKTQTTLKEQQ